MREMVIRFAAYLDYEDQMKGDPDGLPKNFGASKPLSISEIGGLKHYTDFRILSDIDKAIVRRDRAY